MCPAGGCSTDHCCLHPTSTPATCATFTCPTTMQKRPQPGRLTCPPGGCTEDVCCLTTCAGFTCPSADGWIAKANPSGIVCPALSAGGCTKDHCCVCPTTTPATCAGFTCPT